MEKLRHVLQNLHTMTHYVSKGYVGLVDSGQPISKSAAAKLQYEQVIRYIPLYKNVAIVR